ncbi:DUF418 domain-containing protein [Microbacterium marinilacus]|uniref:DUF418 domain-containing protein n=1 Tax=Microbacterium marinilacus TaxID=415209 RepID=A0ABP7BT30_9MICO|nr:DUF418 domain-containing protein [Microbacterium marinilacus]MBY0689052.1 DUF418 domain-containing protein [Microbacterium marinilacus]
MNTRPFDEPGTLVSRWRLLDSVRGFALAGILLVNSIDITEAASRLPGAAHLRQLEPTRVILDLFVQTRFVPIFAFLFGMSFWFVLQSARRRTRTPRPWAVLLRRMGGLVLIGAALLLVYPGNILIEYGLIGLVVLPVIMLTPPVVMTVLGGVTTIATFVMFGGGPPTVLGLMLLGAGSAALGLPRVLETRGALVVGAFLISLTLAVPALIWQSTEPGDPRFTIGGSFGVIFAALYVTGFALLWRTPARRPLAAVFDPLGRMALSNYVGAAAIFFLLARVIDFPTMPSIVPVILASPCVIALQSVISRLWLRKYRYGPVEWLWRLGTWWVRPARVRPSEPGPQQVSG